MKEIKSAKIQVKDVFGNGMLSHHIRDIMFGKKIILMLY